MELRGSAAHFSLIISTDGGQASLIPPKLKPAVFYGISKPVWVEPPTIPRKGGWYTRRFSVFISSQVLANNRNKMSAMSSAKDQMHRRLPSRQLQTSQGSVYIRGRRHQNPGYKKAPIGTEMADY